MTKKVAVVGAGVCGLGAAKKLREAGYDVYLFEQASKPGGLVRTFKIGDTRLECFYHHIFKTDTAVTGLVEEFGLSDKLLWYTSPMGFYAKGEIHDFGTPASLLKFSPISFIGRIRFAFAALFFKYKTTWRDLEEIKVKDWVIKWCGQEVWDVIWQPLLQRKFGPGHEETTAAWLWGRIHPRANSRSDGGGKEELGYMEGSFQTFIDGFDKSISDLGVQKMYRHKVTDIRRDGEGFIVKASDKEIAVDAVVFTGPNDKFLETTSSLDLTPEFKDQLARVRYQSAICTVLELEKPLSHIYWMNISDQDIVFGGVIEQTNFIPKELYDGKHVAYVFNYLHWNHPYLKLSNEELLKEYLPSLKKMYPDFDESWIVRTYNHVDVYASPAYIGRHSENIPPHVTPAEGLFLGSMTQIYPEDRNMNNSIIMGYRAAEACDRYLKGA